MDTLTDKIKQLKMNGAKNTNCVGTALFLLGVHPEKEDVHYANHSGLNTLIEDNFKEVKNSNLCQRKDLVIYIYNKNIYHMGVLFSINPEIMIHRKERNGKVILSKPEKFREYEYTLTVLKYFRLK